MNFKKLLSAAILAACLSVSAASTSQTPKTRTVKTDGTVIINTSEIGKSYLGFNDVTPVEIDIKGGKVISVKALPNDESPEYFGKVLQSKLLEKWNGKTPAEGAELKVDAVSGATYSSKAIIENVKAGLRYELENSGTAKKSKPSK
ncbi:MAG: FMN-binding protein [Bacteroidales bacterium]|nr:FMN-binding protein [Bacteroidales bacterium]